jgi:HK97 family phage portal protein
MNTETRILWLPSSEYEERAALFDYETNSFVGSQKNHAGVRVDSTTALQSTVVLACIRVLSEAIATLPIHVYRRMESGGKVIAREHPLYRILHTAPNSWQTSFEWREQQMLHLGSYGQSFSEIVRDSRDIVSEIVTLHPSRMRVERIETGRLRYTYQEETGGVTTYTQDQIMHIRWLSDDGVNGLVPVELARDAIGLARACEIHGASFFGNGARPGIVLATDSVLSVEAAENLRNNWERVHRGPDRASRTAVLQGGLKPMEVSSSNQESQFLETRRFQTEEICRLYRVPPHLVGDLSRSSFSNIEQQSIDFVQHTLVPWLRRFETAFARDLLFDSEDYFIEFDTRGMLRGDAAARGSYYSTLYNLGVASINEIRGWENLDPVDGGDLRFVGLSMQTLGEANAKVKAAAENPPTQPTADIGGLTQVVQQVSAGTVTDDAAHTMMKAVFPSLSDEDASKFLAGVKKQPSPDEAASQAAPAEPEVAQPTADVNGLLAVLGQVGAGAVTPEAALAIIRAVFPTMPDSLAAAIVSGVQAQAPQAAPAAESSDGKTVGAAPEGDDQQAPENTPVTESPTPPPPAEQKDAEPAAEARVFCATGKGGGKDASCSPKDVGGGPSDNAFSGAPLTSKGAAKWRRSVAARYAEDAEFRSAVDAATLFTQGEYREIRDVILADKGLPTAAPVGDTSLPLGSMTGGMFSYKNFIEGQNVEKAEASIIDSARALDKAVSEADPLPAPIYRGLGMPPAGLMAGSNVQFGEWLSKVQPGDSLEISAPTSFSASAEQAERFATGTSTGQGKNRDPGDGIVIEVEPGARALPVAALSPWKNQDEVLSSGEFEVIAIDGERPYSVQTGSYNYETKQPTTITVWRWEGRESGVRMRVRVRQKQK